MFIALNDAKEAVKEQEYEAALDHYSDALALFRDPLAVNEELPVIPEIKARYISLYDAMNIVCDVTGYRLVLRGGLVMIVPLEEVDDE